MSVEQIKEIKDISRQRILDVCENLEKETGMRITELYLLRDEVRNNSGDIMITNNDVKITLSI